MLDDSAQTARLLIVIADGVRPDVLADEIDAGRVPALAALRDAGGLHTVTAAFPSVTGPAYVPFVMGRHPAHVGIPGLRWFDRAREVRWALGRARSYVGVDIWHLDRDVDVHAPTLFDLARPSLAGSVLLGRGATHGRVGRGIRWMLRAAHVHFRGHLDGWRQLEDDVTAAFMQRFAQVRPRLAMLGILTPDKLAHAHGPFSAPVRAGIRAVDAAVAQARAVAQAQGWGDQLRIWVVGDHGHAPVDAHDDVHAWLEACGHRVLAHPHVLTRRASVALMVSGNAMAHLYVEPAGRTRRWWPALAPQWASLLEDLLARPSVDLACVAHDARTVHVHTRTRGTAEVSCDGEGAAARWSYRPLSGDPLALGGAQHGLDADAAWHCCAPSPYLDALVQLTALVPSARAGDVVLSAAPGWDFRARYEPIQHVSTHGGLLRAHMEVPLLLDAPPAVRPQRTTDVVPSALHILGLPRTTPFDGRCVYGG